MYRTLNALLALVLTVATMALALAPALQTPDAQQVARLPRTELPPVFITGKRLA